MKVVLLKDIKNYGKQGDIVNVNDGFGKNYLLPNNLAVIATTYSLKINSDEKTKKAEMKAQQLKNYAVIKEQLNNITLEFKVKTNKDKVSGAISAKQICEKLEKDYKIIVDKHKFVKFHPINNLGITNVSIKLDATVIAEFKVNVLGE